jgi:putative transposase
MGSRFAEADILTVLNEYAPGASREAICAENGIRVRTLYRWLARRGRGRPALEERLKALEAENLRLRKLLAELAPSALRSESLPD